MRAILAAFGSAGDVHPVVLLGATLKQRGHDVVLVANGHFSKLAERAGLAFVEWGTEDEFLTETARLFGAHAVKGLQGLMRFVGEGVAPLYRLIEARYVAGETVLVATSLALGARIAQEKLGAPLVTVHLSPLAFRSTMDRAPMPGLPPLGRSPRWLYRALGWAGDRAIVDPSLRPALDPFRRELGLEPVARPCFRWWHSTDAVLGLFPEWFAEPQRDWPTVTRLVGFVRDRAEDEPELASEVERFLAAGEAPIVFSPGSVNRHATQFFLTALAVTERLGHRAIFITAFPEQLPKELGPLVLPVTYAPFGRLLPRARALVHHGGIGTCAQAMAAGIAHLIMPMGYDQPDNAARLTRLGVARAVPPADFRPDRVARELSALLASPEVPLRTAQIAERFVPDRARDAAADAIEATLARVHREHK